MATRILRVPHVVIIGGGFGGLAAARRLRNAPVTITLVDRRNHHVFQPLLYQVATAALSPADISAPIRSVLRKQRNAEVLMAEVTEIDRARRRVILAHGPPLEYDYLIVATGATHAYFGHPEWENVAPGLKTLEDATEIRRRFLLAFEAAEQEPDPEERRALLTFVVVGAGPTGVEMAGAMSEIARHSFRRDFRHIDPAMSRVVLIEGGPRVLAAYHEELSAYAMKALEKIGVEVRTDSVVTKIESDRVWIGDESIRTHNVVWAAGVTASPLGKKLGLPTDRVGRVVIEKDLTVPGHPEIYVIGDLSALSDEKGKPLPGVAPVANQMGAHAAANIRRTIKGENRKPFHYVDKGSMATIGRRAAIMETAGIRMSGWIAWMAWLFIHIMFLVGFRNRVLVFVQWAFSYLTWQRGARLITGEVGPDLAPEGLPLGAPRQEHASLRDAKEAEAAGSSVPADDAELGWMGGDRDQAAASPGGGR
ncbi:MAG TPA: NAD(P)/FAD-dependent oxidoreductase [Longimicrobium sp.]|nr:NAD(P)/FAD-dependent oxidoreductase [Longimicrobium sp.]